MANTYARRNLILHRLMPFPAGGDAGTELRAVAKIELLNALIGGVTVPRFDDDAADARYLRIDLLPEVARFADPCCSGEAFGDPPPAEPLLPSTFSVTIADVANGAALDAANVGPSLIRAKNIEDTIGDTRDYGLDPPFVELSDVTLQVRGGGPTATDLAAWFTSFIIQGNGGPGGERAATLAAGDSSGRRLTLGFGNAGIFRFDPGLTADGMRRLDFYVETATLTVTPAP